MQGMATTTEPFPVLSPRRPTATVEVVVPVYNEERALDRSVRRLRHYLDERFPFDATVTIADNASTDGTWVVATRLAAQLHGVRAVHLDQKGRGRALRAAWSVSEASVVAYMDVDLATDLDALLPLVAPLLSGHSDVAIGSRLARGARVVRGPMREVVSRCYNLALRALLRNGFTDAQCGFKAMRADVARTLLPLVADDGWFFDTELLVLAETNGMRIHEVPVDWVDDPDSRVDVVATAAGDLRGLLRMARRLAAGDGRATEVATPAGTSLTLGSALQTRRYAGIGGMSTLVYLIILLAARPSLGTLTANAVALTVASVANFAAHRCATLPPRGGPAARDAAARWAFAREAMVALVAGLALSTAGLAGVSAVSSSVVSDLAVVVAANAVVSAGRFVSFRGRTFRQHRDALAAGGPYASSRTS
jgi:putative flippase GtrA